VTPVLQAIGSRTPPFLRILFLLLLLHPRTVKAQDRVMDFSGPFGVSGIVVEGNAKTKERIILRELTFAKGDTLDANTLYDRLKRSRQNLLNLGLFNTVGLLPTFLGPHEVFITITVNERWFWWPTPIVRFADPNFNTWWLTKDLGRLNIGAYIFHYNTRGLNETLYAQVQFGYSKQFGLRYRFPFIDRRQRWGLTVGGAYLEQDEITIGTVDNKRILLKTPEDNIIDQRSADLQATLRPDHDLRHTWRASWTDANIRDTVALRNPDYFIPGATHMAYLTLGYTFAYDRRDSRTFALNGPYAELGIDRYGIGASSPGVTTLTGSLQRSWRQGQRWSLGAKLQGKATLGGNIPYFVQEGLGYDDYVRGYEYYIIDGQHIALAKVNVLFALLAPQDYRVEPIPWEPFRTLHLAVYLNAFMDQGYVWDHRYAAVNPLANSWLRGYGLGLDLVTSYDQVLRVEYAVNALSETAFYLHFSQPF
jgi:outer membrane protein assembly factor BamA